MKNTMVGVDLAKGVIQVCTYTNKKVRSNVEMTHHEFLQWLLRSKPIFIVFEACGMSNYWKQKAVEAGHQCKLISAKLVSTVRQDQKTDKNDALAIVQAPILRLRELAVKQKTALSNQIKALLLEFNVRISKKDGGILRGVQSFIEDAENELNADFRKILHTASAHYGSLIESIKVYELSLEKAVNKHSDCKKLLTLEGVGTVDAVNLYIALGCAVISLSARWPLLVAQSEERR